MVDIEDPDRTRTSRTAREFADPKADSRCVPSRCLLDCRRGFGALDRWHKAAVFRERFRAAAQRRHFFAVFTPQPWHGAQNRRVLAPSCLASWRHMSGKSNNQPAFNAS